MKNRTGKNGIIKRSLKGLAATAVLVVALLIGIVATPNLLYAKRTELGNFTVYHEQALPALLGAHLKKAEILLQASEFYQPGHGLDLCLNDGSAYPGIIHAIQSDAFAYGFADKVVLQGEMNSPANKVVLRGYAWNLEELLAHEATHCLQAKGLGFWNANPLAGHPMWKWEGYAEYVARKGSQGSFQEDLAHYRVALAKPDNNGWIAFDDGAGTVLPYYRAWLLVRYCLDGEGMSYRAVLGDTRTEEEVWAAALRCGSRQPE